MLVTRVQKLNKKSTELLVETTGLCIQAASGQDMEKINWTGLISKYASLLEESMKYNYELAQKLDGMDTKLDAILDNMD